MEEKKVDELLDMFNHVKEVYEWAGKKQGQHFIIAHVLAALCMRAITEAQMELDDTPKKDIPPEEGGTPQPVAK